jgi:trehalose/maltose hydrolase-like predicted phosphorylase
MLRIASGIDTNDVGRTGAGGVHLAAMGSVWQALAYGFAGLRPRGDALVIDPCLPAGWPAFGLRVQFRGVPLDLRLERNAVVVRAPTPVVVVVGGRRVTCGAGESRVPRTDEGGPP